jgi:hypothetical protein
MEAGICKLCLKQTMLCDSHFIPAGLYTYCKGKEIGVVRFTHDEITETTDEITTHLLCRRCENHLNREGENWLLPKLATVDKKFPFYDIVKSVPPDTDEDGVAGYATSRNDKVGFRKLTNFAIGVFWKASVHSWRSDTTEPWIDLGSYGEPFRRFLSEHKPFPYHAVLIIGMLPPEKAVIGVNLPWQVQQQPYQRFLFYIPGLLFVLNVGSLIPQRERQLCFFKDPLRPIVVDDFSGELWKMMGKQIEGARVSKRVLEHAANKLPTIHR